MNPDPFAVEDLLIDFGRETTKLCLLCRSKNRFNMLVQVEWQEDGDTQWFRACNFCDVSEDRRREV